MATKEHRRQAKGLVEELESRIHAGPPVGEAEITSAREFLQEHDFARNSEYFDRLATIQVRAGQRTFTGSRQKRNYGGKAAGQWMQLQSVYDHVILSACYAGEFNTRRGRIKISHRFNQAGRIDFVELKFLQSLDPRLDGALRKLVLVEGYSERDKNWYEAEASVLSVLPHELVFVFKKVFQHPREEVLAWLVNIGHWSAENLLNDLRMRRAGVTPQSAAPNLVQLPLDSVLADDVARPILERVERLESTVDLDSPETVIIRYYRK